MSATTIDEVLSQLEKIINDSQRTGDRVGYFAALYYKVTSGVKTGIAKNEFEDGPRMARLDVIFANRYLEALDQWKNGRPLSASWKVALDATRQSSLLVLQHLLLGMNAHINLDLGIAAVEVMQGQPIEGIQKDFDAINTIIGSLTNEVIREIDRVSPLLSLLGLHADRTDFAAPRSHSVHPMDHSSIRMETPRQDHPRAEQLYQNIHHDAARQPHGAARQPRQPGRPPAVTRPG